jgi:hypothetical protein
MNRLALRSVVAAAAAIASVTFVLEARAATPQNFGSFMTFGGMTNDSGSPGMCVTAFATSVYQEPCCVQSNGNICTQNSAQYWRMDSNGLIHQIISGTDYGCLDVYGNNPANGVVDVNPSCSPTNQAEVWSYNGGQLSPHYHSGYCLDVTGGNQGAGTTIGIAPCNNTLAQSILPLNFTTQLRSDIPNQSVYCLDVTGPLQALTDVEILPCGNGTYTPQWFTFEPNLNPGYHGTLFAQDTNGQPAICVQSGGGTRGTAMLQSCGQASIGGIMYGYVGAAFNYGPINALYNNPALDGNQCEAVFCVDGNDSLQCTGYVYPQTCATSGAAMLKQEWIMQIINFPIF